MAFTASYTAFWARARVRIVLGPSVAISVVLSAQSASVSARAATATSKRATGAKRSLDIPIRTFPVKAANIEPLSGAWRPVRRRNQRWRALGGRSPRHDGADRADDPPAIDPKGDVPLVVVAHRLVVLAHRKGQLDVVHARWSDDAD